jgi:hypothetical protein
MSWLNKHAEYEKHRAAVEEAAESNPYPFKKWFDQSGRIYIPLESGDKTVFSPSREDKRVIGTLEDLGYKVSPEDYIAGLAEKNGRKTRIGKILRRYVEQENELIDRKIKELSPSGKNTGDPDIDIQLIDLKSTVPFVNGLEADYANSHARAGKNIDNKLLVVISQLPHDIGSMSTNRGWTSCMNLDDGHHKEDIYCEVAVGSLVAYLIREEDKQIAHPIGRIHIKRLVGEQGDSLAIPETTVYGVNNSSLSDLFLKTVKNWIGSKQKEENLSGRYNRVGGKWSDSVPDKIYYFKSIEEAMDAALNLAYEWYIRINDNVIDEREAEIQEKIKYDSKEEAERAAKDLFYDSSWRQDYGGEWEDVDENDEYVLNPYDVVRTVSYEKRKQAFDWLIGKNIDRLTNQQLTDLRQILPNYAREYRDIIEKKLGIFKEKIVSRDQEDIDVEFSKQVKSMPEGPEKQIAIASLVQLTQKRLNELTIMDRKIDTKEISYSVKFNDATELIDKVFSVNNPIPQELVHKLIDIAEDAPLTARSFSLPEKPADDFVNRIEANTLFVLASAGEHSPIALDFYRKMASKTEKTPPEKEIYNTFFSRSLLRAIEQLGNMGQEFIPFLQHRIKVIKDTYNRFLELRGRGEVFLNSFLSLYKDYANALSRLSKNKT